MKKFKRYFKRYFPLYGIIADSRADDSIAFETTSAKGGRFIIYHFFSSLILYGGLYVLLRYVIL